MLITQDIQYQYTVQKKFIFPNLHCNKGEQWLILGQSGAGKTTFLHLLAGLLALQCGEVRLDGILLNQLSKTALDHFRGRNIGIIFQQSFFIKALTVYENLAFTQQLVGIKPSSEKIKNLTQQLNIAHKLHSKPQQLSQGEQQRVSIARALINEPKLLLADEPTAALDDKNCDEVIQLLENQSKKTGATLLIVTHDNRLKSYFNNQITLNY